MKILHIITALVYGGAEKLLVSTANELVKNHEITVCYLKDEARVSDQFDPRIKIIKAPYGIKTISFLRKLYKNIRPDIVHTHCPHADILGHVSALGLKLKMFTTIHNVWIKWNAVDYAVFFIYRVLFAFCKTRVVAISDVVRDHAICRLGVKSKMVSRIYNAVPEVQLEYSKKELRTRLGISQTFFCVLFIGRLEQQKSVDTLIRATAIAKAKIQNLHIIIIGKGSLKEKLVNLSKSLSLNETISFVDPLQKPEDYYATADVFVLPSVYEGFGIVIVEAFRASLPVISTNIEGPKELICNESNGLLIEPQDHNALSESIIRLARDADLRKKIGTCGRKTYEGKFTIPDYVNQLLLFYREAIR